MQQKPQCAKLLENSILRVVPKEWGLKKITERLEEYYGMDCSLDRLCYLPPVWMAWSLNTSTAIGIELRK